MSLRQVWNLWYSIFLKPQSCLPISLFRICLGLCVFISAILSGPDLMIWFGTQGWVSTHFNLGHRPDLFLVLGGGDSSVVFVYWTLVISSITLTLGLFSRISAGLVWLALISLNNYNPWAFDSGEALRRICAFFLMFSPCGSLLSLDRYIAVKWKNDQRPAEEILAAPWAQRLIQMQVACVYWQAFWGKLPGPAWQDGSALYYVLHLHQLTRVSIPFLFDNIWFCKLSSWATLVIEFSLWALIWIKDWRYAILIAGLFLHIGIDLTMNIPVFEWAMMSTYLLFVDAKDYRAAWSFFKARFIDRRQEVAVSNPG
jgi:hypothetical protein